MFGLFKKKSSKDNTKIDIKIINRDEECLKELQKINEYNKRHTKEIYNEKQQAALSKKPIQGDTVGNDKKWKKISSNFETAAKKGDISEMRNIRYEQALFLKGEGKFEGEHLSFRIILRCFLL